MSKNRLFQAILRQDFKSFIEKVFNELNPGIEYEDNWHIDFLADHLCDLKSKRLIINIPPRSLKSIITSVSLPAFLLGHNPNMRIIAASFARSLALKHSLDTRFIMESNWYKSLFPSTIISKKQNQKAKFLTSKGGFRMSVSVGSMVTGEGADILIIDDPHNPSHIFSKKRRDQVINWYEQSFSIRLNNKEEGSILLVMQRLHHADLTGYLKEDGDFELISIPAIADKDYWYKANGKKYAFKEGSMFHSKRFSNSILKNIEKDMGMRNYSAQYMQNPICDEVGMISIKELSFYDKIPDDFDYFVLSLDSAIKTSENSDYSACSIWGIKGDYYYLIFLYREKPSYPELKRKIFYYNRKYAPRYILIEDHASGSSLIQDMRFENIESIIPIRPKNDKITRFASIMPILQSGRILLPRKDIIIKEITEFPHSKHDDIVDSISQFLQFMKANRRKEIRVRNL